ncbi:MAG TPA: EamA family transporter [Candidatus Didemnitutus sp.]|jgi:drug/metabolite transporter (DMT)-like permease
MTAAKTHERGRAIAGLLAANLFWGLSFPLIKALDFIVRAAVPEAGTTFVTALSVAPRFLIATAILMLFARRAIVAMTAAEARQGLALGLTAGAGMYFQNDGLQFASASVSAFLTQFYAILIPAVLAVRRRRLPPAIVWLCGALVLAGAAILARFDPRTLVLGRGEIETLVGSVFFMGQILVLADRRHADNRVLPVTGMMFATEAVAFSVLALAAAPHAADVLRPWSVPSWLGFTGLLTVFCTLGAFLLMNRWQPVISATEAGLIYCTEPVFTALMALFLPAVFSIWAGFSYPNEVLEWRLLAGGGLITAANVLIQLKPPSEA